jgi:hypothetical protein
MRHFGIGDPAQVKVVANNPRSVMALPENLPKFFPFL